MGEKVNDLNGSYCKIPAKKKGWWGRFLEKLENSRENQAACVA